MALVVEDGTGVAGANSYVSLADARAYAASRGLTLPADDAAAETLLSRAMDYLELEVAGPFQGEQTFLGEGGLRWPRRNVRLYGADLSVNAIPKLIIQAQCQLAIELQSVDPLRSTSGEVVQSRKFDAISTTYATSKAGPRLPTMPKVDFLLRPLLRNAGRITVGRA